MKFLLMAALAAYAPIVLAQVAEPYLVDGMPAKSLPQHGATEFQGEVWFLDFRTSNSVSIMRTDQDSGLAVRVGPAHPNTDHLPSSIVGSALGKLFYRFYDRVAAHYELWCTDGTTAGTFPIEVPSSHVEWIVEWNGHAYFRLPAGDGVQTHMRRTGGSPMDASTVFTLSGGIDIPAALGNWMVFASWQPGLLTYFRSDGTSAGTVPFFNSPDDIFNPVLGVMDDHVFFWAINSFGNHLLCRSDGTTAGTNNLGSMNPWISWSLVHHGIMFFVASDNLIPSTLRLWRTDGSPTGTFPVSPQGSHGQPGVVHDEQVYFAVNTPGVSGAVWRTDGTLAGTKQVYVAATGTMESAAPILSHGGRLYLSSSDPTADGARYLWTTIEGSHIISRLDIHFEGSPNSRFWYVVGRSGSDLVLLDTTYQLARLDLTRARPRHGNEGCTSTAEGRGWSALTLATLMLPQLRRWKRRRATCP